MTVYIDPPMWPGHGTVWSHLISDASRAELHEFAAAMGLPRRSFDLDHYDVPHARYEAAIAHGATPVSGRELVQLLQESGLRVKPADRPHAQRTQRAEFLQEHWAALLPRVTPESVAVDAPAWSGIGARLLERWREPHRYYHDDRHLEDVLLALDQLAVRGSQISVATLLAAWFHDAIYDAGPEDEAKSAELASRELTRAGVEAGLVTEVASAVLATHPLADSPPGSPTAKHLTDADVSIFAAPIHRYREYAADVRREYAHVPNDDFAQGRTQVLHAYLERPRIYSTPTAFALWEDRARANIASEITQLAWKRSER